jgi:hypothetical protein
MIEALGPTLAPFVPCEKPQDSPRLAASFITNARRGGLFCGVGRIGAANGADLEGMEAVQLCLFLLSFSRRSDAELSSKRPHRMETQAALPARNYAAHIRSTPVPDDSICINRHISATFFGRAASRSMRADIHGRGSNARIAAKELPKT